MNIKQKILLGFSLLLLFAFLFFNTNNKKANNKYERYYQIKMCKKLNGKIEYVLPNKTRVDCLTNKYAIEVDWAKKWAESIGQSLYYSNMTSKKPAIGLIIDKDEQRYLKRLKLAIKGLNIKIIILEKEND